MLGFAVLKTLNSMPDVFEVKKKDELPHDKKH